MTELLRDDEIEAKGIVFYQKLRGRPPTEEETRRWLEEHQETIRQKRKIDKIGAVRDKIIDLMDNASFKKKLCHEMREDLIDLEVIFGLIDEAARDNMISRESHELLINRAQFLAKAGDAIVKKIGEYFEEAESDYWRQERKVNDLVTEDDLVIELPASLDPASTEGRPSTDAVTSVPSPPATPRSPDAPALATFDGPPPSPSELRLLRAALAVLRQTRRRRLAKRLGRLAAVRAKDRSRKATARVMKRDFPRKEVRHGADA